MNRFSAPFATTVICVAAAWNAGEIFAQQPGWSPNIIASSEQRQQIQATPIEQRPYRPLHFYGNTIRRMHYRGTPLPTLAETLALPFRIVIRR